MLVQYFPVGNLFVGTFVSRGFVHVPGMIGELTKT